MHSFLAIPLGLLNAFSGVLGPITEIILQLEAFVHVQNHKYTHASMCSRLKEHRVMVLVL